MFKPVLFVGALLTFAGPAVAAPVISFTQGGSSPGPNQTVVYDFDNTTPASLVLGPLVQIKTPPADGAGAPPASSTFPGPAYLSVLGGGSANILFDGFAKAFSFDWGSVDAYNTLTLFTTDGPDVVIPGSDFATPANGNQSAPSTNGRFNAIGTGTTKFTGFKLSSSANSFEIDNVALAGVPEPSVWAFMILGFGAVGGTMRRRAKVAVKGARARLA